MAAAAVPTIRSILSRIVCYDIYHDGIISNEARASGVILPADSNAPFKIRTCADDLGIVYVSLYDTDVHVSGGHYTGQLKAHISVEDIIKVDATTTTKKSDWYNMRCTEDLYGYYCPAVSIIAACNALLDGKYLIHEQMKLRLQYLLGYMRGRLIVHHVNVIKYLENNISSPVRPTRVTATTAPSAPKRSSGKRAVAMKEDTTEEKVSPTTTMEAASTLADLLIKLPSAATAPLPSPPSSSSAARTLQFHGI